MLILVKSRLSREKQFYKDSAYERQLFLFEKSTSDHAEDKASKNIKKEIDNHKKIGRCS